MPLITDHLARCIRTLESSLTLYRQAEPESIDQEVSSSSNECSETSDIRGNTLDATPVKDILRLAATHSIMTLEEVERWFAYRDNLNTTAHDYGKGFAQETLRLLPSFITDVKGLEHILRTGFNNTN